MNNLIQGAETKLESSYFNRFILQVYGWMTIGVFTTFIVGFGITILTNNSPTLSDLLFTSLPIVFMLELLVVLGLSFFAGRINGFIALGLFMFYAVLNGVFFGVLMQIYTFQSIYIAFGASFLTFAVMSLYGYFTKADLTKWRNLAIFGLIGLFIGTIINIIISLVNPSLGNGLYWILTYVGLGIFIILIAADTQKLKQLSYAAENSGGSTLNYSTQGALILYLDFINIFIRILMITGKRR